MDFKVTEFIFDMLYIVPLALTAMLYRCGLLGMEERTFAMYAVLLIPLSVFDLFVHLKAKGRLLLSGLTAAVLISVTFVVLKFAKDFSLSDYPWLLPFVIISLAAFVLGFLTARLTALRIVLPIALVTMLVLSLTIIEYPAGKGVFAGFFFILVCLSHEIHIRWKRFGDTDVKKHMVFTAPFIFGIIFIASLFKTPDEPYDWRLFVTVWNRVVLAVDKLKFNFGSGTDAFIGFSDSGEIGSGVERNKQPKAAFEVTTNSDINVPVYFAGTIYDSFNGHEWTTEKTPIENARRMDSFETAFAAKTDAEDYRDIIRDSSIMIKYLNIKSKYLFAPSKLTDYAFPTEYRGLTEEDGVYSFAKHNPYRVEVRENFYRENTDSPAFYDYMASEPGINEETWKSSLKVFGISKLADDYGYDKYLEYKRLIKEKYCEDVELSPEIREKLDELYEGSASEYEKMKRLEASLGLMDYTTDTDPIPDYVLSSSDFLEHMLLEKKEGYCTHYATTFVLLARAEGLPARFVQGFRLTMGKAGTYTITSDMAHAWAEVYFEGKGWITFEPTPGFYEETSWLTVADKMIKIEPTKPKEVFNETNAPGDVESEGEKEEERIRINILVFLIPLGATAFVLALFLAIGKVVSKHKYERMPMEKKARLVSKDIIATLSMIGYKIDDGETLKEFADRIAGDVGDEIYPFVNVYERVLYTDVNGKIEILPVLDFHDKVLDLLKRKNILKYAFKMLTSQVL